jgi:hypothetical protein
MTMSTVGACSGSMHPLLTYPCIGLTPVSVTSTFYPTHTYVLMSPLLSLCSIPAQQQLAHRLPPPSSWVQTALWPENENLKGICLTLLSCFYLQGIFTPPPGRFSGLAIFNVQCARVGLGEGGRGSGRSSLC